MKEPSRADRPESGQPSPKPVERYTERLRLEPVRPQHADDLLTLHSDDKVAKYWGPWSIDDARKHVAEFDEGWRTKGVHKWMAYDRKTGELVGRGGLSRLEVDGQERLEVGWTVRDRFLGQGYATEIGRAGLGYAFDELDAEEVVSFTEPHNEASRAVMERLGMHYSRDIVHNGEPFVLYALERSEFIAGQHV